MTSELISSLVAVLTALIGLAIISVILSKNSSTVSVVKAGGSAFDTILSQAVNAG